MSKNSWDTDWLIFSKRARRGALVFLFLFVIIAVAPSLYRNYFGSTDLPVSVSDLGVLDHQIDQDVVVDEKYKVPEEMFDPNDYSLNDWMEIGLSKKQSQSILNYLEKGGQINFKQDLQKLYVIDEELYKLLAPQVLLPNKLNETVEKIEDDNKKDHQIKREDITELSEPLNINTASKKELVKVKGIGDFYADEIIERREKLGGIHSIDQLADLYKMTDGKLDSLSEHFFIDPSNIKKIDINLAGKKELLDHPLINADVANSIVFIRERYGNYNSLDGLLQSPYINTEKLKELSPYLKVK